jgi:hypothetical protein
MCLLFSTAMHNQTLKRSKTQLIVKSNSHQVHNVGSSRNVLSIHQAHPHSELLGTEAMRAHQVEAVAKQHDHFLSKFLCYSNIRLNDIKFLQQK